MVSVPGMPAGAQSCRRLARARSASWPPAEALSSPERHTSAPVAHALAASLPQHLSLHELSVVNANSQQYVPTMVRLMHSCIRRSRGCRASCKKGSQDSTLVWHVFLPNRMLA